MTDSPLKMFSPQVYYFFAAVRQIAQSNAITAFGMIYPHTASICGGFALSYFNASQDNSAMRANPFGDVDVFTSMRFDKHDILQLKSAFRAFGGEIFYEDPEVYFGKNSTRDDNSSDTEDMSEDSLASKQPYTFGNGGIIAIRDFHIYENPTNCRWLIKVQIITMDSEYHIPPAYPLWKSVVQDFDISVCRVSIPDENSEGIAYSEEVQQDIAKKQFSYRMRKGTFPPTMYHRINKYLGKGYLFREIKFDQCKGVLSFSNATIR